MSFEKAPTIAKYRANAEDTGSTPVQIALLTERINYLAAHFKGHVRLVEALEFSRDGSLLISGGVDETVRLWDVMTGESRGATR